MISPKKLIKMARKWQRFTVMRRKKISFWQSEKDDEAIASYVAEKGHFVMYTTDQKRFIVPIKYLNNRAIRELLEMSEEEFGLPRDGPIRLPCDATLMQQIVSMIQGNAEKNIEKALLMSIKAQRCLLSFSLQEKQITQQFLVCSY